MKIWRWGRWPLLVALWWAAGCDDASTGNDSTGVVDDADTEGPNDHDDPPPAEAACDDGDGPCAGERLCDAYPCGGRAARFNHFGCPRVACSADADCPAGEACFSLAYERICEPASTTCAARDGACVCEATDDCDGVLDAHCLPTQFYPPAEYCDSSVFACDELPGWAEALDRAAASAAPSLSDALAACASTARAAAESCS